MRIKGSQALYLGDGVYVQLNDFGDVILTTGTHIRAEADNTIVLEAEVLQMLIEYLNAQKLL